MMIVLINQYVGRLCGLAKDLSRDLQLLLKIAENIESIQNVVRDFKCDFSQTEKGLCRNKYAFDLCAFYMAQIGEKIKGLTDGTYAELDKSANLNNFRYFRNMIDHSYENVNRVML